MSATLIKRCYGCGIDKELAAYRVDSRAIDGRTARCRDCLRKSEQVRYERDLEFMRNKANAWYYNHHKEVLEKRKQSRVINRENELIKERAYYAKTKKRRQELYRLRLMNNVRERERRRNYAAWYRVAFPERVWIAAFNARRRRKGAPGKSTNKQIIERIRFFGGCCAYCGGPFQQLDHVIPISKGGTNWPSNIRPSCKSCNLRKSKNVWYKVKL